MEYNSNSQGLKDLIFSINIQLSEMGLVSEACTGAKMLVKSISINKKHFPLINTHFQIFIYSL